MKPLRAVDLKHRIAIKRGVKVDNGKGGYTTSWTEIAKPFAEVVGLDGREAVMEHVLQGISFYRLRIWYRDGVSPADQVRYAGRDLNIRSVSDPWGNRRELVLLADTGAARSTT